MDVPFKLFLARHEGEAPQTVLAAAANAKGGAKVAAALLLREAEDGEVLSFLKDICLKGPQELREPATDALLVDGPKKHHLPIFVEGLLNEHYRTVQGSAWAVQSLGATEAASNVVDALRRGVEHTESRLLEALEHVATERELDYHANSLDHAIADALSWYRRAGLLS